MWQSSLFAMSALWFISLGLLVNSVAGNSSNGIVITPNSNNGTTYLFNIQNIKDDFTPQSSYCYPNMTSLCNLRSAWSVCMTGSVVVMTSRDDCVLQLPSDATSISFNTTFYGELVTKNQDCPQVIINGTATSPTTIQSNMNNHSPYIPTTTIYETGMLQQTSSGQNITSSKYGNVTICSNEWTALSTQPYAGDPLLRLFDWDSFINGYNLPVDGFELQQLAFSDNDIGLGAQIVYYFTSVTPVCKNFMLVMGCASDFSCSMDITKAVSKTPGVFQPRFLYASYWQTNVTLFRHVITSAPTLSPSQYPTESPTPLPSEYPTEFPTYGFTDYPTLDPNVSWTDWPTFAPWTYPTEIPNSAPTEAPSVVPSESPTDSPNTSSTEAPSVVPSESPTLAPSAPTAPSNPTIPPTEAPTLTPPLNASLPEMILSILSNTFGRKDRMMSTTTMLYGLLSNDSHPTAAPTLIGNSTIFSDEPTLVPTAMPTWAPTSAPAIIAPTVMTLKNVQLSGFGTATLNGGAIMTYALDHGTFEHVQFQSNTGYYGGAFYSSSLGEATLDNCRFDNSIGGYGGAIAADMFSTLTVSNTMINQAKASGYGGGMFVMYGHTVSVIDSSMKQCSSNYNGGAIEMHAITGSTVTQTSFQQSSTELGSGGSIHLSNVTTSTLSFLHFNDSSATSGHGGAIAMVNCSSTFVDTVSVSNVNASQGGGAMFFSYVTQISLMNSTIQNALSVSSNGGGVYVDIANQFTLLGVTFQNTRSIYESGGAISLRNVTFSSITGLFAYQSAASRGQGGVLYCEDGESLEMTDLYVRNSHAVRGGAISLSRGHHSSLSQATIMDTMSVENGGALLVDKVVNMHVNQVTVSMSQSTNGSGGCLSLTNVTNMFASDLILSHSYALNGDGGGLYVSNSTNAALQNITCNALEAYSGGAMMMYGVKNGSLVGSAIANCKAVHGNGGGMFIFGAGTHEMSKITFVNTTANRGSGGAISASAFVSLVWSQLTVSSASSKAGGGGISATSGHSLTIQNTTLTQTICTSGNGGGIEVASLSGTVTLSELILDSLQAGGQGGCMALSDITEEGNVNDCTLTHCSAIQNGGGMYMSASATNLDNIRITNSSGVNGGGIYATGFDGYETGCLLSNVAIHGCTATSKASGTGGGALYLDAYVECMLYNWDVQSNTATEGGGLFLIDTTEIVMVGGNITGNTASDSGGGISLDTNNNGFAMITPATYENQIFFDYSYNSKPTTTVLFNKTVTTPGVDSYWFTVYDMTLTVNEVLKIYVDNVLYLTYTSATTTYQRWVKLPGKKVTILFLYQPTTPTVTYNYNGWDLFLYPMYCGELDSTDIDYRPAVISNNYAALRGGGLYFGTSPVYTTIYCAVFDSNEVTLSGGGIQTQLSQTYLSIDNVTFVGNNGGTYGGGLQVQVACAYINVTNSFFVRNTANYGGGLMLGSYNGFSTTNDGYIQLVGNSFSDNEASISGGAIYFAENNLAKIKYNMFINNKAISGNGGAWVAATANTLSFTQNVYLNNQATTCGGAMAAIQLNVLTLAQEYFYGNQATRVGGAICLKGSTTTVFQGLTQILSSYAYMGGAIAAFDVNLWELTPSSTSSLYIANNKASRGSGLYCHPLLGSSTTNSLHNITFANNTATAGGTVYWLYDATATSGSTQMTSEPPGLYSSSNKFINNVAGYGVIVGTQAVKIVTPSFYNATVFGASLSPPIVMELYDYYGQFMPISNDTTVVPTIVTTDNYDSISNAQVKSHATVPKCESAVPNLLGNDIIGVEFQNGYASFSELQVACSPRGNLSILFEAQLGVSLGLPAADTQPYYISNVTLVSFRDCIQGEFIDGGQCTVCPYGKYSFDNKNALSCDDCTHIVGVKQCYGNHIEVEQGYWRRYPTASTVFQCPLDPSSCIHGNYTGNAVCGVGYTGPMCSICDTGYYLSDVKCLPCGGTGAISTTLIVLLIVCPLLVIIVLLGRYYYNQQALKKVKSLTTTATAAGTAASQSLMDQLFTWWKKSYSEIMVRVKIIISTFQIITVTSTVFKVSMPPGFTGFANSFKIFNLNFSSLFPIGCSANFNFMTSLLWSTMSPILIGCILTILFLIEYYYFRRQIQADKGRKKGAKRAKFAEVQMKYINYFFYITYLILPSVTTTIFQIFICTNLDPHNEDNNPDDYFLTADMSISCTSDYYYQWVVYAIFMIILYPVGIPSLYLYVLYINREEIKHRDDPPVVATTPTTEGGDAKTIEGDKKADAKDSTPGDVENQVSTINKEKSTTASSSTETTSSSSTTTAVVAGTAAAGVGVVAVTAAATVTAAGGKRKLSLNASAISFLYSAYEPAYWYWEIVDTTRRLLLTAILSVISPGTSRQNIISIILAVFYIRLYSGFQPYAFLRNDILAEVGQVQIFFTFFVALIVQNSLLTDIWATIADVLLVMINFSVLLTTFYFQIVVYRNAQIAAKAAAANNNSSNGTHGKPGDASEGKENEGEDDEEEDPDDDEEDKEQMKDAHQSSNQRNVDWEVNPMQHHDQSSPHEIELQSFSNNDSPHK